VKSLEKNRDEKRPFLVPINTNYDLYNMGPDGRSGTPLTANHSRDDIIRANNGEYIGPAYND
jgi:general secretion pathway protein G